MRTVADEYDDVPGRGMGRGVYREPELDAPASPAATRDLTLGMTALLGIFLAVALVCAVFFGFGYSTGRTLRGTKTVSVETSPALHPNASNLQQTPTDVPADTVSSAVKAPPLTAATKPPAGAPLTYDPQNAAAVQAADEAAARQPGARHNATPTARPSFPTPVTASDPAGAGVMVQIAAVARPGDADMLARALRTNGYPALVRTEPQDKLLHVQIGPFATRDQAKAMRVRLQGDGYNAFLKP